MADEQQPETFQQYMKRLLEERKNASPPKMPFIMGNCSADIFMIQWKDVPTYVKMIDRNIGLIMDFETKEIVGVELWGCRERLLKQVQGINSERDARKGGDV